MMTTVGTVGTVLTRSVSVAVSVNPIGSVTVTVMLCSPELRALVFRVISPLEFGPCVENSPSMFDTQLS